MLGKLHRRAAVTYGKVGLAKRPGALGKLRLQRAILHLVDEIERPRPDLRLARQRDVIRGGGKDDEERQQRGQNGAMADRHVGARGIADQGGDHGDIGTCFHSSMLAEAFRQGKGLLFGSDVITSATTCPP